MKINSVILILLGIICLNVISAWPLSFANGTITDLGTNETINGTNVDFIYANNTLFIIPKIVLQNITIQNITFVNFTNITYLNSTGNYTIQNITNITYQNNSCYNCTYNTTGVFYNRTDIDNKFGNYILTSTANGQFAFKTELPNLTPYALKTDINASIGEVSKTDTTPLWIAVVIGVILSIIAILMARGSYE